MNKDRLITLFQGLAACRQSSAEATFLSIGGRGYYENPASDLLQFFLVPKNAHGLNTLFIDALLEVTGKSVNSESLETLTVEREKSTKNRKRIDLLLKAEGWIMLIENKIWHEQINPFEDYKKLAESQKRLNDKIFFVILSPSGYSSEDKWTGLSYRKFIDIIQKRLDQCVNDLKASKWWHFAQDFIHHLDQELYGKTMTPEEIKFAQENFEALSEAEQLKSHYRDYLLTHLPSLINTKSGKSGATSKKDSWRIRLFHACWPQAEITWFDDAEDGNRVKITTYIGNILEEQFSEVKNALEGVCNMEYWTEKDNEVLYHCWKTENSFDHGATAETMLLELSNELFTIFSK